MSHLRNRLPILKYSQIFKLDCIGRYQKNLFLRYKPEIKGNLLVRIKYHNIFNITSICWIIYKKYQKYTVNIECLRSISIPNKLDAPMYQILFWNDTLHVSDGLSVHHQVFKTAHTATGICQTDTAVCFILFWSDTTCFGRSFRPSSGFQDCTYSNRHLSNRYCCLLDILL